MSTKYPQDDQSIEEQASLWVIRIDEGSLSKKDKQAFDQWISHTENRVAFVRLAQQQVSLDASLPCYDVEENINKTAKSISELILKKQEVTFSKT